MSPEVRSSFPPTADFISQMSPAALSCCSRPLQNHHTDTFYTRLKLKVSQWFHTSTLPAPAASAPVWEPQLDDLFEQSLG